MDTIPTILPALPHDAQEILAIQIEAFSTVASLYGQERIPPMDESVEEVRACIERGEVLKALHGGLIVGAVRGTPRDDGAVLVGRLAVPPASGGRGIGRALMVAIEEVFPEAFRFVLYTGERTPHTRRLYESLGYVFTHDEFVQGNTRLLWMAKEAS